VAEKVSIYPACLRASRGDRNLTHQSAPQESSFYNYHILAVNVQLSTHYDAHLGNYVDDDWLIDEIENDWFRIKHANVVD